MEYLSLFNFDVVVFGFIFSSVTGAAAGIPDSVYRFIGASDDSRH